ncbi:MAG: UvrD-helicase domain-containing protein, partial [Woeseiaceae bacterium]
ASREQWLSITGAGFANAGEAKNARRQLESNIEAVVGSQLEIVRAQLPEESHSALTELLRYAAKNLTDAGRLEHPFTACGALESIPAAAADQRANWQSIANLLLTKAGTWRKSINKNDGFPPGDDGQKDSLLELIAMLCERHALRENLHRTRLLPAADYSDEQWRVLTSLFDLLPLAVGELRRLFGERGVSDHNEVALSAGRALGSAEDPGDIALVLDYKIQHLLVDEMQDTSFGQYELLKKIIAGWNPGDGRTVFCVGDPMQSIYRFRDAEVGEFLLTRKNGIGNLQLEPLVLRRNFRSGEHIVHWVNTVFTQVMPVNDNIAIGAISYAESVPVPQHADAGECRVHSLFDADSGEEAERTLAVIRDCLQDTGSENVAVLVRSRTQLAALLPLLRLGGIEYQAVEIDRLTDLPEIIDAMALTRALCHEGDRLAWLAVLRSPWIGLKWQDLHTLTCNDTSRTVSELLADDERLAAMSGDGLARVQRFLEVIVPYVRRAATWTLRNRVEMAWCALGGPALLYDEEQLENVYRFFSVVEKIEQFGTLDDVRELERRLDDERVSSVTTASCRVQVMTMHKAKGLQFDHVVLPGLGRATRGGDKSVLSWLNIPTAAGGNEMIISPVGSRTDVENDPLHQFIEATEKDRNKMELDRLLYVACTRAVKSLHLIGSVATSAGDNALKRPVSGSLLSRLWCALERYYADALSEQPGATKDAQADTSVDGIYGNPILRRFDTAWCAPTPQGHKALKLIAPNAADEPEHPVEFYWVGTAARHAGTIVHRLLQRLGERVAENTDFDLSRERVTVRRWARDLGVAEEDFDTVWERARRAVETTLSDPRGQWLLSGSGHSELAVTGVLNGRPESVVIDRVRIDDDGVHWIVDYKTSTHEGGDLNGFLRQESDRYRPQLRRYAEVYAALSGADVKTALYFPLLKAFCEVSTTE